MDAIALTQQNLPRLAARVERPVYDRRRLGTGIVHLGLGGFHRAHMARYTHELLQVDFAAAQKWGIAGATLLPGETRIYDSLAPQDALYTLVERDGPHEAVRVIGSLTRVLDTREGTAPVLAAIDHPDVRIVSLTVTEHGYCLNRATKRLDDANELIRHDIAEPTAPRSAIGVILEAYRRRRDAGHPAFTTMSCDNIQLNGHVLRDAVLALAGLTNPALGAWIAQHGAFPSTMVDRITPVTTAQDIADLRAHHGIDDAWPVICEPFSQWVIEDHFIAGRPDWDRVGAQFVSDVTPYEKMKLRLLNTSHLAVASLGELAGYRYIDETMRDASLRRYMTALMDRETGPTLAPVPGVDLAAYQQTLITRFANPAIKDTVARVNRDAPLNVLVDPLRDRVATGGSIELLALALAAWLRRLSGTDDGGAPITVSHPLAAILHEKALTGGADPRPLLAMTELFGELGAHPIVVQAVGTWLARLIAQGSRATLDSAELQSLLEP